VPPVLATPFCVGPVSLFSHWCPMG